MTWFFGTPLFLWLLPLVLFAAGRRPPKRVQLASTDPWREVSTSRLARLPIAALLFWTLLVLSAARPHSFTPPAEEPDLRASVIDRTLVLDRIVAPDTPEGTLRIEGVGFDGSIAERPRVTERIALPSSWAGRTVRVIESDRAARTLQLPSLPPPTRVVDRSGEPSVDRALRALASEGWVALADGSEGTSTVVIEKRSDAGAPATDGAATIVFPGDDATRTRIFPEPRPHSGDLLRGLAAESWTIEQAIDLDERGEAWLVDDQEQALIDRLGNQIRFAFTPAESDLPERLEWPILIGRAIETLASPPAPSTAPSTLPTILLILAALGLVPFVGRNARERLGLGVATLALLILPSIPAGAAPTRTIDREEWERGPAVAIAAAARTMPWGGVLELPAGAAPPFERDEVNARLIASSLTLGAATFDGFTASPQRLDRGEEVTFRSRTQDPLELTLTSPTGETIELPRAAEVRQTLSLAGVWIARDEPSGVAVAIEVAAPIEVTPIGSPVTGALSLFGDPEVFTVNPSIEPGVGELPMPPSDSIAVLEGLDLDRVAPQLTAQLIPWLRAGGTLFAIAGPPFRGSENTLAIDELLPAPLPPPPRPPIRDHGVLLLDLSGSIAGEGLETLWSGVATVLRGTPPEDRWGVAGFRSELTWILPLGTPIDDAALERVRRAAQSGGGTRLDVALRSAARALPAEVAGARSIVVLTDGRSGGGDWRGLGRELGSIGIDLTLVAIGARIDATTLTELRDGSGGRLLRAPDRETAVRLFAEQFGPRDEVWKPASSPLQAIGSITEGWPARLAGPLRRLDEPFSVDRPSEPWILDGAGAPLWTTRSVGSGRTSIWWSGFDEESLPAPRAANRLKGAIAESLARQVRGGTRGRPPITRTLDRDGEAVWLIPQRADDPPRANARLVAPNGTVTDRIIDSSSGFWIVPAPLADGAFVELPRETTRPAVSRPAVPEFANADWFSTAEAPSRSIPLASLMVTLLLALHALRAARTVAELNRLS